MKDEHRMKEWTKMQWEQQLQTNEPCAFYLYTPMCGTCEVASKMLVVIEELLPNFPIGMANINYLGNFAIDAQIESVPCLIVANNGGIQQKVYAFQSVPYIYGLLKK